MYLDASIFSDMYTVFPSIAVASNDNTADKEIDTSKSTEETDTSKSTSDIMARIKVFWSHRESPIWFASFFLLIQHTVILCLLFYYFCSHTWLMSHFMVRFLPLFL